MNKSPLLSVLIPVFNGEKYIKEAVDSVLNQTYTNFELIVCNDGSTDSTATILKNYKDPRIVLVEHDERKGIPFSRNELLEKAKSSYITWLDADDIALPTRLAVQIKFLTQNPQASCCLSNVEVFDENRPYQTNFFNHPVLAKHVLFFRQPFFFSSCMARKYKSITFDEFLKRTQDFGYLWELAQKGEVGMVNDVLVKYRLVDHNQKPDFENTQLESFYTQKKKLLGAGLEFKKHQVNALNKYLRNNKQCSKSEITRALKIIKAVVDSPNLSEINLSKNYVRAIYSYQVIKAIRFHSWAFIKHLRPASPKLIWQLVKMKM